MRPEDLYDAFHEIDDDLLKPLPEAAPRRHPALRWGALAACALRGSENNDPYYMENGAVRTRTNHAGGILGGLSTGMPVLFRAAFKPTPSIALPQQTVRLSDGAPVTLELRGRHDPCIVPRAVPCVEAAAALAVLDAALEARIWKL